MAFISLNLIAITVSKTGIDDVVSKYVTEGIIEDFAPGEAVFILKDGSRANVARKSDINWEMMDKEALLRANKEAVSWGKEEDGDFISIRHKVQKRPVAFIDISGKWHDEDEDGLESELFDIPDYNDAWSKAFREAPEDSYLSHWNFIT